MANVISRWFLLPLLISGCGDAASGSMDPMDQSPPTGLQDMGTSDDGGQDMKKDDLVDPGTAPWVPVEKDKVAELCQLDPTLLEMADKTIARPWAVVRHGLLCHEFYPDGNPTRTSAAWSATKTLGALTFGAVMYHTRDLKRTGARTGPLSDLDRADAWIDGQTFNKDALLAHVLAMVAHNKSLAFGDKKFSYDALGTAQINRLSDAMNAAIAQDKVALGGNLEGFFQKFVAKPLGLQNSTWSDGKPDKVLAYSWMTTVRDMARVGLLLQHHGRWNGEQLVGEDFIYAMSHPSFEDASTGYGYLTWLNSSWGATDLQGNKKMAPEDACAPVALHQKYPHTRPPSMSPDCGYPAPNTCQQDHDVGIYWASGLGGQKIIVHAGLDMVLIAKDFDHGEGELWSAVRPALVALDPMYKGDDKAFCAAYSGGTYAPAMTP